VFVLHRIIRAAHDLPRYLYCSATVRRIRVLAIQFEISFSINSCCDANLQ
jgi:hypothetical protein